MKITKLRIKPCETEIHYREENTGKNTKETKYLSSEEQTQEFLDEFQKLTPFVIELLGLPTEYGDTMTITGLSITHEDAGIGIVISAQKELSLSSAPLCLNTPYIPPKRDDNTQTFMDSLLDLSVEKILDMALQFMQGKYHVQTELELNVA